MTPSRAGRAHRIEDETTTLFWTKNSRLGQGLGVRV